MDRITSPSCQISQVSWPREPTLPYQEFRSPGRLVQGGALDARKKSRGSDQPWPPAPYKKTSLIVFCPLFCPRNPTRLGGEEISSWWSKNGKRGGTDNHITFWVRRPSFLDPVLTKLLTWLLRKTPGRSAETWKAAFFFLWKLKNQLLVFNDY